jgi:hypothetical protein
MATTTITIPAKLTIEGNIVTEIDIGGSLVWLGETYIPQPGAIDAIILSGASLTSAIDLSTSDQRCGRLMAIHMPAAWTTASLTFQGSPDGITYQNIYNASGAEYSVAAAASRDIILPPGDFAGFRYLKIRSGTSGTPVTQAADRTLTVLTAR